MPRLTDLHARRAEARRRYADRHQADEPLADPELVACHVRLPAYMEPPSELVPIPDDDHRGTKRLMRNLSGCVPGEKRLQAEV
jgi:hypothetical protein